jgi:hypothetical protein
MGIQSIRDLKMGKNVAALRFAAKVLPSSVRFEMPPGFVRFHACKTYTPFPLQRALGP